MGTVTHHGHAGGMTTSTLTSTVTSIVPPARPADSAASTVSAASAASASVTTRPATVTRVGDRVALLALVAPLLLFAHGIAEWVDGLGDGLDGSSGRGPLALAAATLLVLATAAFAWLTTSLGARPEHLPVAVPTALLAAFGAGATGAVWLGGLTGFLPDAVPFALASGGQVLTGIALALVLATTWLEGRMPAGSLVLAGGAAALLALPLGLEPLGALVLLIALAPLTRRAEAGTQGARV
jgi:hypothetical protein